MTGGGKFFGAFETFPSYVPPNPAEDRAEPREKKKSGTEPVFRPVNKAKPTPTYSIAALNAQR